MLTNALTTTLALALAIPGGVLAIDAANDNAVPGISTSEFFREHGPSFGRGHGGGHSADHQAHADSRHHAHDKAHHDGHHAQMSHNGTHGHHDGHGKAAHSSHGPDRSVHLVARCLANDDRTTDECIQLAGRLANATVAAVATCMDADEPRRCYAEGDGPKSPHAARIAHCIEENGTEPCAQKLATHLLCHGAHLAGVESPVDCPAPEHRERHGPHTTRGSGSDDTTTTSDDA